VGAAAVPLLFPSWTSTVAPVVGGGDGGGVIGGVGTSRKVSVLTLPLDGALTLASKERAPYHVLVEVEENACKPTERSRWCWNCRHRAAASPEPYENMQKTSVDTDCDSDHELVTRCLHENDRRPKGLFKNEAWGDVVARFRRDSEYGERRSWSVVSLIVKSNAHDVRQEELAYHLMKWFQRVFRRNSLKLWLKPFTIIATAHDGGCLETVTNAISIDALKRSYGNTWVSLKVYFEQVFNFPQASVIPKEFLSGSPSLAPRSSPTAVTSIPMNVAMLNFIYSMAAYSIVCYVLAIRDRHNGNILIDEEGHIIHVDFGFMLCGAPGGKAMQRMGGFEHSGGFKLTHELVEVLGGHNDRLFEIFRENVVKGMVVVRRNAEELLGLLELGMLGSENSAMPCFQHATGEPQAVLEDIRERLRLPPSMLYGGTGGKDDLVSDAVFETFVGTMVDDSVDHWRSRLYDKFQYHVEGVH